MKLTPVALFLVAIISGHVMVTSATNWLSFTGCLLGRGLNPFNEGVRCAAGQMRSAYREMSSANCRNCDKYFHCKGNYNAVRLCKNSPDARRAAEVISGCREFSQGGMDADGRADDVANRYGRNGGNCERLYLCWANCKYNPKDRSCKPENC